MKGKTRLKRKPKDLKKNKTKFLKIKVIRNKEYLKVKQQIRYK